MSSPTASTTGSEAASEAGTRLYTWRPPKIRPRTGGRGRGVEDGTAQPVRVPVALLYIYTPTVRHPIST